MSSDGKPDGWLDPYANPISEEDEAEMVAEAKALYEVVQDESRWDEYIEERISLHRAILGAGGSSFSDADAEIMRISLREFLESERAEPFQSAYWIPVEFW